MLETLEERRVLEKLVEEINILKRNKNYQELHTKVEELVNLYLGENIVSKVRNHIEEYVENWIIRKDTDLELEDGQTSIRVGREYIRKGAWREGNEEDINLDYFYRFKISKYVAGFTCGQLKYEFAFPNQVIEQIDSFENIEGYNVYRYTNLMDEKIEIRSTNIADNLFEVRKKYTSFSHREEKKENKEILFYEETPFGNIEIDYQERKLELIKR